MEYQKYFDYKTGNPQKKVAPPKADGNGADEGGGGRPLRAGDRRDGLVYLYNDKIELAVNVALAAGRPVLVRGPSGSGKSSLARNVARRMRWWYYEHVITSRTQARDLLWTFDTLKRLSDAQTQSLKESAAYYVEPGVLWWAFDPRSAGRRGLPGGSEITNPPNDPGIGPGADGAVVLLDEIDKADPDVPNNLLVPLGSLEFKVRETDALVEAKRPVLVIITTNDERTLPTAFMRRCVILELDPPDEDLLVRIAEEHYGADEQNIYRKVASRIVEMFSEPNVTGRSTATKVNAAGQLFPSTAEYLDTVRACMDLGINPEKDSEWEAISKATLWKRPDPS